MDPLFCVSTAGLSSHMPCAGSEHGFDGRRRLYGRLSPVHCILGAVQSYHGGTRRACHALCCGRLTLIDIYPYKQVRCVWLSPARSMLAPLGLLAARSGLLGRRARFGHFPSHTRAQVRVHVSLLSSCCAVQALRAQALRRGNRQLFLGMLATHRAHTHVSSWRTRCCWHLRTCVDNGGAVRAVAPLARWAS